MSTNETTPAADDAAFESQQLRFSQGILFRGKFFGVEDVKKETGDDVCQDSMVKLKAVLAAKKESKTRICIKINLEGIELVDEKTNTPLYKHSVNRISYIARDIKDARAIGYIYKNSENSFQYFGLRTLDQAQLVFNTLKELFEVVLKLRTLKKKESESASSSTTTTTTTPAETTTQIDASQKQETKTNDDSEKKTEKLIETNEKSSLISNEEPREAEKPQQENPPSLVDFDFTSTTAKPAPPEQKPDDPLDLFSLTNPAQSPTTPPINTFNTLNLNDSLFSVSNTQPPVRPAPTPMPNLFGIPNSNQMMTLPNMQMNQPTQGGFMSQPFNQTPNPFQAPTGFNQTPMNSPMNPNPFGNNTFGVASPTQPPRPQMSPMSTPQTSMPSAQPNFNDLFSLQANKTPAANNPNTAKTNSPFQW